jgi:hypothetical protein
VLYFEEREHEKIYNQVSCEVSLTTLRATINTPQFVCELYIIDQVWKIDKKPQIQCYLWTSVKNCYMDFHIDMNGSAVWYHVMIGKNVFCLIKPTESNLKAFAFWMEDKWRKKIVSSMCVCKKQYHL